MIARIWRGWATPDHADKYETLLREKIIPGIEARNIPGLRHIDILRRVDPHGPSGERASGEIEFSTIFWFDAQADIANFVGEDLTIANMPAEAKAVLSRWDERAVHYEVLEQRVQR